MWQHVLIKTRPQNVLDLLHLHFFTHIFFNYVKSNFDLNFREFFSTNGHTLHFVCKGKPFIFKIEINVLFKNKVYLDCPSTREN